MMRILNLYAGLGGNRLLWENCQVTAVEKRPQIAKAYKERFPKDEIIVGDALEILVEAVRYFDFIWASPPCQSHSKFMRGGQNRNPQLTDMSLWQIILFLQDWAPDKPWCVENVFPRYEAFIPPTAEVSRHCLWSNFRMDFPPQIDAQPEVWKRCNMDAKREMEQWLGMGDTPVIYYDGNHNPCQVLQNCLHPEYGQWVLEQAQLHFVPEEIPEQVPLI